MIRVQVTRSGSAFAATAPTGFTPQDLWSAYNFPAGFDGTGTTIGLAEWGSGYSQADVDTFCAQMGLPSCEVEYVAVDGGTNDGGTSGGDMECTLDIEVAHGAAPGAKIRVYEAPSGPDYATFGQQVTALLRYVLADPQRPDVLSISYGDAEADWSAAEAQQWESLIAQLVAAGTLVFVASGDQGSYGTHAYPEALIQRADAPATCPSAIAVGGTRLVLSPRSEVVWDESGMGATGGGFSSVFARPAYQDGVNQHAMRGIPDLSAVADPFTGYAVVFEGQPQVVGGTSASCPLIAGLFARILQARKAIGVLSISNLHATLYQHPECFRPITQGNNGFLGVPGFPAGAPWSAACGLGVPDGEKLLALLAPAPSAATVPDKVPVFIDGTQQTFDALLQDGMAYVPAVLTAEAFGATATRDLKGVYITKQA